MTLARRATLVALTASLFVATAGPASAQSDADKATARSLGQEGQEALDRKDFKTAEDRFKRAESLFHAPTLALGLARSLAANGKYVAAQETYNRIIREGTPPGAPAAFVKAVEDAKSEVASVSPKIGGVTITVAGPESPKVMLDDTQVPSAALGVKRPVDPGAHVVKATAEGYEPAEMRFSVAEGGSANAALTMKKASSVAVAPVPGPAPAGPSTTPAPATSSSMAPENADTGVSTKSSQKTFGWVALGVGGAGLAVGAITGLLAIGKHSDLKDACGDNPCPADKQSDVDSFHTMGTISTIGFIVGGVGVAAGTVLLLTAPKAQTASATKPSVTPFIGLGTVGAVGRF
jgi:hypothetical protein